MRPHKDFRLWLTSEVHPKFPTILLQSSIKITYEAPPGIKKNLLRTFEMWTPEEFSRGGNATRSQILFLLAWFHAIAQERRKYIPQVNFFFHIDDFIFFSFFFQGWTKFYEFSQADLRAGYEIIHRLCDRANRQCKSNVDLSRKKTIVKKISQSIINLFSTSEEETNDLLIKTKIGKINQPVFHYQF